MERREEPLLQQINMLTCVNYTISAASTSAPLTLTMMALGFPMTHRLILLSSPPVASILPLLGLRHRQFTVDPWATNSAAKITLYTFNLLDLHQEILLCHLKFTIWRCFRTTASCTSVSIELGHHYHTRPFVCMHMYSK